MIAIDNSNHEIIQLPLSYRKKDQRVNEDSLVNLSDLFENHLYFEEASIASNERNAISLIDSSLNYKGNYENYVIGALNSITQIKKVHRHMFSHSIHDFGKSLALSSTTKNKKLLVLDLDETLIHSDFQKLYDNYDAEISFTSEGIDISVGIFIRTGLFEFLNSLKEHYQLCVFTASTKEYADSVINYLDPNNSIFSMRLYREHCINLSNNLFIKDLSIFDNIISLNQIIIVDNSIYSFMKNISNGILINSFYNDKSDLELYNLTNYLIQYISKASDVREVNEQFFNFKQILTEMSQ